MATMASPTSRFGPWPGPPWTLTLPETAVLWHEQLPRIKRPGGGAVDWGRWALLELQVRGRFRVECVERVDKSWLGPPVLRRSFYVVHGPAPDAPVPEYLRPHAERLAARLDKEAYGYHRSSAEGNLAGASGSVPICHAVQGMLADRGLLTVTRRNRYGRIDRWELSPSARARVAEIWRLIERLHAAARVDDGALREAMLAQGMRVPRRLPEHHSLPDALGRDKGLAQALVHDMGALALILVQVLPAWQVLVGWAFDRDVPAASALTATRFHVPGLGRSLAGADAGAEAPVPPAATVAADPAGTSVDMFDTDALFAALGDPAGGGLTAEVAMGLIGDGGFGGDGGGGGDGA